MIVAEGTHSERPPGVVDADALEILAADHDAVECMFDRLGDASSHDERAMLAGRICRLLAMHASCEEELLYPAASMVLADDRLVRAAEVDHAAAKELARRVEVLSPSDSRFLPALTVLRECVAHHAGVEERDLFPRLRHSRLDLLALGIALIARRTEFERPAGGPTPNHDSATGDRDPETTLDSSARVRHGSPSVPRRAGP